MMRCHAMQKPITTDGIGSHCLIVIGQTNGPRQICGSSTYPGTSESTAKAQPWTRKYTMTENWIEEMKVDSLGTFVTFGDEDERVLKILSEPVKGISRFPTPSGEDRPEYTFDVIADDGPKQLKWSVSAKQVMQQLLAIMKKDGLKTLTGETLRVTTSGQGKDRRYIVRRVI